MELTSVEICAILNSFFVKGKSSRETFHENQSVLQNATVSLQTAKEWFRRFRGGENDTNNKPAGGELVTKITKTFAGHI